MIKTVWQSRTTGLFFFKSQIAQNVKKISILKKAFTYKLICVEFTFQKPSSKTCFLVENQCDIGPKTQNSSLAERVLGTRSAFGFLSHGQFVLKNEIDLQDVIYFRFSVGTYMIDHSVW